MMSTMAEDQYFLTCDETLPPTVKHVEAVLSRILYEDGVGANSQPYLGNIPNDLLSPEIPHSAVFHVPFDPDDPFPSILGGSAHNIT